MCLERLNNLSGRSAATLPALGRVVTDWQGVLYFHISLEDVVQEIHESLPPAVSVSPDSVEADH